MNKIIFSYTEHLRPSRSIEAICLKCINLEKQVFVYNYEGIQFRFFESMIDLIQFFEFGKEPENSFTNEVALDKFLKSFEIKF
jgi:hypothetical protein